MAILDGNEDMIFLTKICKKCGATKKFLKDTPRDQLEICGDCWNWTEEIATPNKSKDLNSSATTN